MQAIHATATSIRAVGTDLDGTLLRSDGSLSARTADALRAAEVAGLLVIVVTARPPRTLDGLAIPGHPVAICSNGALVYDVARQELIQQRTIDAGTAAEVVRRLRQKLPDVAFAVEAGQRYGREPHYASNWDTPVDALIEDAEQLVARPLAKILARVARPSDPWELVALVRELVGPLVEVTSSGPTAGLEMSAPGVTKGLALQELTASLGMRPDQVVAFGDMPNDLPMLAWAGVGCAVANAHPDVIAAADVVVPSCDDDGVAVALEILNAAQPIGASPARNPDRKGSGL